MKNIRYLFFFLLFTASGYAENRTLIDHKTIEVENCLVTCYHIDHENARTIISRVTPLLENVEDHPILDDFIKVSTALSLRHDDSSPSILLPSDALVAAPDWHEVLLENSYVRVLYGYSKPGDVEPFHTHQWRHLMLILTEARFKMESAAGAIEVDTFPIGFYDLPAEDIPMAYTNVGVTDFNALIFEIKD